MSNIAPTNPTIQSSLNRASKDKFILVLTLPEIMREMALNDPQINIETLQMSVWGAVVPTATVPHVEATFGGQSINVASHIRPNYSPLTLEFIVDNSYHNYYVLWKWLSILNSPREGYYLGKPIGLTDSRRAETEYQTTFSILALDEYNEVVMKFNYYHAFITSLGGIKYSYKEGDILETTADFQYNQFDLIKPPTKSTAV